MAEAPVWSIVIPTRGRGLELEACLERLRPEYQRGAPEFEVIVADDGARSEAAVSRRLCRPGVRIVEGPERGPAANRNAGARAARGRWLVFLDDDCEPGPDLVAAYSRAAAESADRVLEGRIAPSRPQERPDEFAPINEFGGLLWSCNMAIERSLFEEVRGFDERYPFPAMEDVDLRTRLAARGIRARFVPEASVVHPWRRRPGWRSLRRQRDSIRLFLRLHPGERSAHSGRHFLRCAAVGFVRDLLPRLVRSKGRGWRLGVLEPISQAVLGIDLSIRSAFGSWRDPFERIRSPRALLVLSQPVQNWRPLRMLERLFAERLTTAICSEHDERLWHGEEYLNKATVTEHGSEPPRLRVLRNRAPRPSLGSSLGLMNFGVAPLVSNAEVAVLFGHRYATFWIGIVTALALRRSIILTTDATSLDRPGLSPYLLPVKKRLLRLLYTKLAAAVLVPSGRARDFVTTIGAPPDNVFLTPYCIDEEWFDSLLARSDRARVRSKYGFASGDVVALCCGKLIERKRVGDLIEAVKRSAHDGFKVIIVGDGPLRAELERSASSLAGRVVFAGLVPYPELVPLYAAADLLVHPASFEPFGLPVLESMRAGRAVIASDAVGASADLITHGENGFISKAGDAADLARMLDRALAPDCSLEALGRAARRAAERWSSEANASQIDRAIRFAARRFA